ncbi:MAG: VWA domain-containing protein [Gemmatales bacterium]|nr:VWA domain-containing protein [Gemmatales bacterium]MDW7995127.1 VWA domain-containing protein [Gemmatales bacterium]
MTAKIHLERMMHRDIIRPVGESIAAYALIKLIPTGLGEGLAPLPLNVALVLDVSGSMYEEDGTGLSRLQRIQEAAMRALGQLQPSDLISIIAFGHDARVILPPTPVADRKKIEDHLYTVDQFNVDPGGTSMDQGMQLALAELQKNHRQGVLSHMVILTDGETSGESLCKQLAASLPQQKMHLTVMGIGTEWNANLLKELAKLSNGKWFYIEAEKRDEAERIFVQEFAQLASTAFTDVQMHLRPLKDVRVKRCRQVVPEIKELSLRELEERHLVADLGTLEKDRSTRYIVDLSLPPRPDGDYVICQVEVTYKVGAQEGTTGVVPLKVKYSTTQQSYVNAEVMKHIDDVQIYEMNVNLQQAIQQNKVEEVKRLAEAIERKASVLGPRAAKKTMLARQALQELHAGGRVSKKTMLALEDSMRMAEEMPTS